MKIFCSISTAGRSLLPAALFGAVLISLAAAVLVFQMRREKWLQALNTAAFLLLFVLLNVVFSKIDRQGDTHGSIDLLTGLLWIIICTAAVTGMLEILLLRKQTGKTIGRNSVKQAIDSLPSAICWFTEEGTVKLCNLQMYRLFRMLAGRDLQMYAEICTALEDCPEGNTNSRLICFPTGVCGSIHERKLPQATEDAILRQCFQTLRVCMRRILSFGGKRSS